VSTPHTVSQLKIDRYIDILYDQKKLIKSSKNIIRKKRSPLARKINNGDVSSIIKCAKDSIYSSLTIKKRAELCRVLCELKMNLKNVFNKEKIREAIATAIAFIITEIINPISGLMIKLLWIIRGELCAFFCKCNLNGECLKMSLNGNCPNSAY